MIVRVYVRPHELAVFHGTRQVFTLPPDHVLRRRMGGEVAASFDAKWAGGVLEIGDRIDENETT